MAGTTISAHDPDQKAMAIGGSQPITRDLSFVYRLTWVNAGLLLVISIAGLLYGSRGWYDDDARTLPAFLGQDIITLLFGLPLLLTSARLTRRGSTRALLCWMGALFYVAYSYYFYIVGVRFNPLFPVYIVVVSIGMYGALAILFAMNLERLVLLVEQRAPVRTISAFLVATALFFAALWLILVVGHLRSGTQLDLVTRTVITVDGVVLLPLLFFGGLWLYRREALGYALAGLLLVKAAATFLTLVINTAIVWSWGQSVDPLQTGAYSVGFSAALMLLIGYLRRVHDPS